MDIKTAQNILNGHGFPVGTADGVAGPVTHQALELFQAAYCGPNGWLDIDGVLGPKTADALQWMQNNNALVSFFSIGELACKHCGRCYVKRELLSAMFALRQHHGPVTVLDAYRCPTHNAAIGGASNSQHLLGLAFDPGAGFTVSDVRSINAFSGIGTPDQKRATHLDCRTNVAKTSPAIFYDASNG